MYTIYTLFHNFNSCSKNACLLVPGFVNVTCKIIYDEKKKIFASRALCKYTQQINCLNQHVLTFFWCVSSPCALQTVYLSHITVHGLSSTHISEACREAYFYNKGLAFLKMNE